MAIGQLATLLRHLRLAAQARETVGLSDGQLLQRFASSRDEAAFEMLLHRHGPLVLGVCRRVLGNPHDAEDAFQATFLVLVRKAASLVPRDTVGNWLYGVAYHTALKARDAVYRRRAKERQVAAMPRSEPADNTWRELRPVLDQELSRLPDKYREPIVLCDLEGKTRKQAARQLDWPEGTVAARIARGRALLAQRLTLRGITLSLGTLTALVSENAATAGVPASLMSRTIEAAGVFAAGQMGLVIPAQVAALTRGVLQAMSLSHLKAVVLMLLVGSLLPAACGVWCYGTLASAPALAQSNGLPNDQPAKAVPANGSSAPAPKLFEEQRQAQEVQKQKEEDQIDKDAVQATQGEVDRLLTRLKREEKLHGEGAIAFNVVEETRLQTLFAQVALARAQKKTGAAIERLQMAIKVREDQTARIQRLVKEGVVTETRLEEAIVALAEARILEGLYTILKVREDAWHRAKKSYEDGAMSATVFAASRSQLEQIRERIQSSDKKKH
jgi:RNA polymerase sigma factor (sigma-70 family)